MVFSGSNGCLYQTPTFKNRFPLYKKSISSTPVSMSTTLLLESLNWCLSSQRIIQLRCLILWYKCDLASSCELPPEKSLSGEETKRRKRPARAVQAAGVGGSRGSQVWKTRGKAKAGGGLPDPLQEVETRPPPASGGGVDPPCRIRRELSLIPGKELWCFTRSRGGKGSLRPCFLVRKSERAVAGQGVWSATPQAGSQGPSWTAHGPPPGRGEGPSRLAPLGYSSILFPHTLQPVLFPAPAFSSPLSPTRERLQNTHSWTSYFGGNKWTWQGLSFLFLWYQPLQPLESDLTVSYKVKWTLFNL